MNLGSASTESKQFSSPAVPESVNLINNSSNGVGTEKKKKVNTSTNSNKVSKRGKKGK